MRNETTFTKRYFQRKIGETQKPAMSHRPRLSHAVVGGSTNTILLRNGARTMDGLLVFLFKLLKEKATGQAGQDETGRENTQTVQPS